MSTVKHFNDYSQGVDESQMQEILLFDLFFKSFKEDELKEKLDWYYDQWCMSQDSEITFLEHLNREHFRQLDYIEMIKKNNKN